MTIPAVRVDPGLPNRAATLRHADFLGLPGGSVIPDNQFEAFGTSWEIRDVKPGATYVLKVQGCQPAVQSIFDTSCGEWTGWDERTFTVPTPQDEPGHPLGRRPVAGGDTQPQLEKQIDLPDFDGPVPSAPTATVAAEAAP